MYKTISMGVRAIMNWQPEKSESSKASLFSLHQELKLSRKNKEMLLNQCGNRIMTILTNQVHKFTKKRETRQGRQRLMKNASTPSH